MTDYSQIYKIPSALKNLAQTKEARKKRKMKIKKNLFHAHNI